MNKAADDQANANIVAKIHFMKAEIERLTNENKILETITKFKAESSTVAASSSSTAGSIDAFLIFNNYDYVSRKKYESLDSKHQNLLKYLKHALQKIKSCNRIMKSKKKMNPLQELHLLEMKFLSHSRRWSNKNTQQDDFCDPSVQRYASFYIHRIWRDIPRHEWSLPDGSCLFDSLRMCLHAHGSSLNVKTSKQFRKLVLQVAKRYLKSGEPVESTGANIRNMITRIQGSTIDESVEYWFNTMKLHMVPGDSTCISIVSKKCNAIIIVREETCNGEFIANHIYQAHGVDDDEVRLYLRSRMGHYVPMLNHSMKAEIERLTNENKILKTKAESLTVAAGPIDATNYISRKISRKKYESLDCKHQILKYLKDNNLLKGIVASGSAGTPAKAVAAAGSSTNPPPAPENGSINDEEYKKLKKKVCPLYMILDSKLRY
jgi:cell division protein FtsB